EHIRHNPDQSQFSVFVEAPSRTNALILQNPYTYPRDNPSDVNSVLHLSSTFREEKHSLNSLEMLQGSADDLQVLQSSSAVKRSAEPEELPVLQSLSGDTAVNFLEPRPSVNPDAEVVVQDE
ncbi:unnamed protein product, partial [Meganyctiphanes norvegica]